MFGRRKTRAGPLLRAYAVPVAMALSLTSATTPAPSPEPAPKIGVYYFPGWLKSDWSPEASWASLRPFPDRKPLLGWYDQGSPAVLERQLRWMADHGIDYVAMDWYYEQGAVRLDEGLRAYLAVPQERVKLSLLWANHGETTTPAVFRAVTRTWIERYLSLPRYLTKNGRPVIFIFSYAKFAGDAKASGSSARAYIAAAQAMAREAGLPGLYLVACLDDLSPDQVAAGPLADGFDAVSGYQFHRKPQAAAASDPNWSRPTHGWGELAAAYQAQWDAGSNQPLEMVVPMTSGFDRRPWGGFGADPLHDRSISDDRGFRAHLMAAREAMRRSGRAQSGLGVICCWNEFGEGIFIEPTTRDRFARLEAIRDVFRRRRR